MLGASNESRTEDEIVRYAYLLDHALGTDRFGDKIEAPWPRGSALVEGEITSEVETVDTVYGKQEDVRKERIKNLKAIRKVLAEKRRT